MSERAHPDEIFIGLVSVSDRASRGTYQDQGIPALKEWLLSAVSTPVRFFERLIPDEQFLIEKTLRDLCDDEKCDLILTTGGTGPARRDVTPEATLAVATREMPGWGEQMRAISLRFVPTAVLSRQTGVLRETPDHAALILNLPGQPKAIAETLGGLKTPEGTVSVPGIFAAVPYCIDLIGGPYMETRAEICRAFRPKAAVAARAEELARREAGKKSEAAPAVSAAASSENEKKAAAPRPFVDPAPVRIPAARVQVQTPAEEPEITVPGLETFILNPGNPDLPPPCTVIWLGAMASDVHDFAEIPEQILEMGGPAAQYIMANAPLSRLSSDPAKTVRAWYDIPGRSLLDREDETGLRRSAALISRLIEQTARRGVPRKRIFLAGFSQGASMALFAGLRQELSVGGIIALSGYLPLARTLPSEIRTGGQGTPVFMGHGAYDEIVPLPLAEQSAALISRCGASVSWREYEAEHDFGPEAIRDTALFLNRELKLGN